MDGQHRAVNLFNRNMLHISREANSYFFSINDITAHQVILSFEFDRYAVPLERPATLHSAGRSCPMRVENCSVTWIAINAPHTVFQVLLGFAGNSNLLRFHDKRAFTQTGTDMHTEIIKKRFPNLCVRRIIRLKVISPGGEGFCQI